VAIDPVNKTKKLTLKTEEPKLKSVK